MTGLSLLCGDGLMGIVCIYVQVIKLIPHETSAWITWRQTKEDEDIVSILFAVNKSSPYLRAWFKTSGCIQTDKVYPFSMKIQSSN